jgi:hypothetical protein
MKNGQKMRKRGLPGLKDGHRSERSAKKPEKIRKKGVFLGIFVMSEIVIYI